MKLTREAILGTGKLALEGGLHPAQLKDSVTSQSISLVSWSARLTFQLLVDARLQVF